MISEPAIREILALYRKHGWILRRVLLSAELKIALAENLDSVFGQAEIFSSDLDALWFSRSSRPESEAWEIRYLNETPFAMVEVIDGDYSNGERDDVLKSAEMKMSEIVKSKKPSKF